MSLEPLPKPFVDRLHAVVPAEHWDAACASFSATKPTSFRVNALKAPPQEVAAELGRAGIQADPVAGLEAVFTVPDNQRRALTQSPAVADGRVYIQGIASTLAPWALSPKPGESALDLCAAPGGKTLMMAAMMQNTGTLNAVEPGRTRFFKLRANLDRAGATMVKTYLTDGRTVGRKTPGRFDKVLVDAPCSGEAMFTTRDPATYQDWSEKKVQRCARVQKALLRSAMEAVRPGGLVLYSTCSMSVQENEAVVSQVLSKLGPGVAAQPIQALPATTAPALTAWQGKAFADGVEHGVRVLPGMTHDAFFLALLQRQL